MMFLSEAALLFVTWLLFSGRTDPQHMIMGAACSVFVALISRDLLFQDPAKNFKHYLFVAFRLPGYLIWLFSQIILANFHVLYLALHPKLNDLLDPRIIEFKSEKIDNDFGHFIFANSITLTPGTVTVHLEDGVYTVHAISELTALGLPEPMESMVAKTFNTKR